MAKKHKGVCPFCEESVTPDVVEENYVRRDRCQCPNCQSFIYVCRSPGCQNYAKGGDIYDDELCPSCTSGVSEIGKATLVSAIAAAVVAKIIK